MSENRHNHSDTIPIPVAGCPECALLEYMVAQVAEAQRLNALTPLALVHECLDQKHMGDGGDHVADDPRVRELMSRVCPGWENLNEDGTVQDENYQANPSNEVTDNG